LVVFALLVRLAVVALTPGYVPIHDDADYDRHACWVVDHGFLPARVPPYVGARNCQPVRDRGNAPTAYRPPLWPALLGATYVLPRPAGMSRWTAGRIVQALIGTALAALVGLIALELCGPAVALAALAITAVYVPLVLIGASLVSEPLFVALVLGAVLAVLRARAATQPLRWALAAGVLVGLASLARANGPIVALPLMAGLWLAPRRSRRSLLAPAALAVAAVLVVAPWTIRNAIVLHAFVPVSTSGGNTLYGTYNETSRTRPDCRGCWTPPIDVAGGGPFLASLRGLPAAERDHRLRAAAFRFAREHPVYVLQVLWGNTVRLLDLAGAARTGFTAKTIDVSPRAAQDARWELFAVLVLAAAGLLLGVLRRVPWFVVALVVLLWVSTALIQSETPRFRAPLDPWLIMLGAAGAVALARRVRRRQPGSTDDRWIQA
jgi:4-amino-4-deoxy-L-arabinose transferase-like glycosyltransferase